MKTIIIYITLIICSLNFIPSAIAQKIGLESSTLNNMYSASISIKEKLNKKENLDFNLMARFNGAYQDLNDNRSLVFSTVSYKLLSSLSAVAGSIFSSGSPLKPVLGFQWMVHKKNLTISLSPNANIGNETQFMQLTMLQYLRNLKKTDFFIRCSALSLVGHSGHQHTIMRFQYGLGKGRYQGGLATNVNLSDSSFDISQQYGGFFSISLLKK